MAIIESGKCRIEYINNHGLGVGKTDGRKVILPYTLPGEIVLFERHAYRNLSNCLLKAIVTPSPRRSHPMCEYFGTCGGCLLQHLDNQQYLQFKKSIINSLVKDLQTETKINPIISIPPGQRRRANMEAIKKKNKLYLGFHRFNSHQIIDVTHCPILSPSLSGLLLPLKDVLNEILMDKQKIQIFLTEASNGIDIDIKFDQKPIVNVKQKKEMIFFAKKNNVARVIFSYETVVSFIYEAAKPCVIFEGVAVEIDAQSFLQSSFLSDKILSQLVINYFYDYRNTSASVHTVLELFCGRGTFTLPLSRYSNVDAFEADTKAINALKKAVINKIGSINLYERDLFKSPLNRQELNKYKALVINPPRAGAEAQCNQIKKSKIEKLCYVSCNPETFFRDAKILCSNGYILSELTPVDQFYWSPHLEIVAYFERKNL